MSSMAGVFSLRGAPLDPAWTAALERALGRSGDAVDSFSDDRLFLAKINVGVLDDLGIHRGPDGRILGVTGDPLFVAPDGATPPRDRGLPALARDLGDDAPRALQRCRGSFCLADYDPARGRLLLATDLCGVRPLFFHLGCDHLFFATAMHLLADVEGVPRGMDVLGTAELATQGFPLGDRTPRSAVKVLEGAGLLRCDAGRAEVGAWFDWREIEVRDAPLDALVDGAFERFVEAVRLRSQRDDDALGFLSGGLDSRVVCAGLAVAGKRLTTLNFLRPGQKDTILAERFSAALGTRHLVQRVPVGEPQWVSKGLAASRIDWDGGAPVARPRLCFTGDGGSVGVGHVYLDTVHLEAFRTGDAALLRRHARGNRPVRLLFRSAVFRRLDAAMARAVDLELATAGGVERERGYWFFLMNNDQRRHLHHHFENIDRYRAEFMMPFYDAELVRWMASVPLEPCLHHRFYYEWMRRFPEPVSAIPWQAYPGHLSCPVESDPAETGADQWRRPPSWDASRGVLREAARTFLRRAASGFPGELLRRGGCATALLLHALRLRDCTGILRTYLAFQAAYDESGGAFQLPDER